MEGVYFRNVLMWGFLIAGVTLAIVAVQEVSSQNTKLKQIVDTDITITEDNIRAPCPHIGYCFFLCGGLLRDRLKPKMDRRVRLHTGLDNSIIKTHGDADCDVYKNETLMRLNMKPVSEACAEWRFEMAGWLIGLDARPAEDDVPHYQYIAVAIKEQDFFMKAALAIYCHPQDKNINWGIIDHRTTAFPVKTNGPDKIADWSDHPPKDLKTFFNANRTFFSCSFTLKNNYFPFTREMGHINFGAGHFHILISHGVKKWQNTTDMYFDGAGLPRDQSFPPDDHHMQKGYTTTPMSNNSHWQKCAATNRRNHFYFTGIIVTLLSVINYWLH